MASNVITDVPPPPPPIGPPVAVDDSYTVAHDHPLVVDTPGLLANDSDPAGAPLSSPTRPARAPSRSSAPPTSSSSART
jgi:hypothetical protein